MNTGEFWHQHNQAQSNAWYNEGNQQNLAELVGMTSGSYGTTMSPKLQKSLAGMNTSFKLPMETLRSSPPQNRSSASGGQGNASGLRYSTFASAGQRESLRSRDNYPSRSGPPPAGDDCLSGIGCGLGTTWIDPRFEPGPQVMYPQGDAIYAHGGHAGGPTFGALTPAVFQTGGPRWSTYVRGYGDGRLLAPCAPRAPY